MAPSAGEALPAAREPGAHVTAAPEVSVVIATRNRWPLLSTHGLPSALEQEGVDLEVIVVDDASEDDTPARLSGLDDPRVRVERHESPKGLAAGRNTGIRAARAEWVAFTDDDDLWSPRKLRLQLDAARNADADWVYGGAVVVDSSKRVLESHPFPDPDQVEELLLSGGNFVPGGGSNVAVRTELVRRLGGFDETLSYFEDWDLWLRLARVGRPAACPEVVVARVEHGSNMLFRDRPDVVESFVRLMEKHRPVTREDRLAVAEWMAYEHYRQGRRLAASRLYLSAAIEYRSLGNVPGAFGVLFGERGMRAASAFLRFARGATHLEETRPESVPLAEPEWLSRYRRADGETA
jgi:glycosyltransferase involved in cell wall biosynthesis